MKPEEKITLELTLIEAISAVKDILDMSVYVTTSIGTEEGYPEMEEALRLASKLSQKIENAARAERLGESLKV